MGSSDVEKLADRLIEAHSATLDWLTTVLAEDALGGPAALRRTPLQAATGVAVKMANVPMSWSARGLDRAVDTVRATPPALGELLSRGAHAGDVRHQGAERLTGCRAGHRGANHQARRSRSGRRWAAFDAKCRRSTRSRRAADHRLRRTERFRSGGRNQGRSPLPRMFARSWPTRRRTRTVRASFPPPRRASRLSHKRPWASADRSARGRSPLISPRSTKTAENIASGLAEDGPSNQLAGMPCVVRLATALLADIRCRGQ